MPPRKSPRKPRSSRRKRSRSRTFRGVKRNRSLTQLFKFIARKLSPGVRGKIPAAASAAGGKLPSKMQWFVQRDDEKWHVLKDETLQEELDKHKHNNPFHEDFYEFTYNSKTINPTRVMCVSQELWDHTNLDNNFFFVNPKEKQVVETLIETYINNEKADEAFRKKIKNLAKGIQDYMLKNKVNDNIVKKILDIVWYFVPAHEDMKHIIIWLQEIFTKPKAKGGLRDVE